MLIRHTLSEIDGQLRMDAAPVLPPTRPLFRKPAQSPLGLRESKLYFRRWQGRCSDGCMELQHSGRFCPEQPDLPAGLRHGVTGSSPVPRTIAEKP